MRKQLAYIIILIFAVVGCEEIYNPVLDKVEDVLVVEGILMANQQNNYIHLYKSLGFSDISDGYSKVSGARVYIVNVHNAQIECTESGAGNYLLNFQLKRGEKYYLSIEVDGETYKSEYQVVPEVPVLDSIYYDFDFKTTTSGIANSTDNIITEKGIQLYSDMDNKGTLNHYRFSFRKILQYFDYYDTIMPPSPLPVTRPIYCWHSYYPTGIFNIAGPPEYSTSNSISKHELEFFEHNYYKYVADTMTFAGWIYFIYQYGINEDTYNYYSDLNSQLDASGKIFDPVYVQAVGNIKCTSNPDKVVLGNFEISSFSEKGIFMNYTKYKDTVTCFKTVPYFYNIPESGHIKNDAPDFWETPSKKYPNE